MLNPLKSRMHRSQDRSLDVLSPTRRYCGHDRIPIGGVATRVRITRNSQPERLGKEGAVDTPVATPVRLADARVYVGQNMGIGTEVTLGGKGDAMPETSCAQTLKS